MEHKNIMNNIELLRMTHRKAINNLVRTPLRKDELLIAQSLADRK
ncbi:MAG: hypothetical protein ABSB40_10600 [Nitrososphaeria archaeon]